MKGDFVPNRATACEREQLSGCLSANISSIFAERDADKANEETRTPNASERTAAELSEERDTRRLKEDRSKVRASKSTLNHHHHDVPSLPESTAGASF